jgi:hypothetical protein
VPVPGPGRLKPGERLAATGDPAATLLVRFAGRRLLDRDGNQLAELAADGRWYTSDGTVTHGLTQARRPRDADTIERDAAWLGEAVHIIRRLAERQQHLTSDDVWAQVKTKPSESRMMGNAFARAQHARVVTRTSDHQPSRRRENHGREILIWQSLRFGQQTL